MVLAVGDKVIVFSAGSDYSYAKKIEPVSVGSSVDVITLSDGTKLSLPRLKLNTGDYVFVIPTWDPNFPIGGDFTFDTIPLGAAVFTVSSVTCYDVVDEDREWDPGSLAGYLLIVLSGTNRGQRLRIVGNDATSYTVTQDDIYMPYPEQWEVASAEPGTTVTLGASCSILGGSVKNLLVQTKGTYNLVGYEKVVIPYRIKGTGDSPLALRVATGVEATPGYLYSYFPLVTKVIDGASYWTNSSYPSYDKLVLQPVKAGLTSFQPSIAIINIYYTGYLEADIGEFVYLTADCPTDGIAAGDRYVVYDPITKRLKFNDAAKTILASASWRDIVYPGEVVTLPPVEYVWDGQGYVYLSQSKTTLSTIFYDNELRVEAYGDNTEVKAIDYHACDTFTYSGETVSRELVNITGILRAGKNFVQLKVRDTGGSKVGFPTPIYLTRTMDT